MSELFDETNLVVLVVFGHFKAFQHQRSMLEVEEAGNELGLCPDAALEGKLTDYWPLVSRESRV